MTDRRVIALGVSARRCERTGEALRRDLVRQRQALAAQVEQCERFAARLQAAVDAVDAAFARLDAMTSGEAPFSPDDFNDARRYLDVLAERQRACEAELNRQQALLEQCEAALAGTRGQIAANDARLEFIRERTRTVERELDNRASDAADDEAQENALARMLRERSAAA